MLRASIGFFVFGLVAYLLGAYNVGGMSLEVGKMILVAFLVISVLGVLVSFVTGRSKQLT
jgi:uncharacterized membrane protein YtjA (UPF0391 family)